MNNEIQILENALRGYRESLATWEHELENTQQAEFRIHCQKQILTFKQAIENTERRINEITEATGDVQATAPQLA